MNRSHRNARIRSHSRLHHFGRTRGPTALALAAAAALIAQAAPASFAQGFDVRVEIGGSTTSAAVFDSLGEQWVLFHTGSHLKATRFRAEYAPIHDFELESYVRDIEVFSRGDRNIALVALGNEGLVAVDVTHPEAMQLLAAARINCYQDGITWTEGGGDIVYDNIISSTRAYVSALATDGLTLWVGTEDYGIHRTALAAFLGPDGPTLEPDGTLLVEHEVFTLQYAGENAWGGVRDLELFGGRLFAALGALGMGVFDRVSLEQVGAYNLYTDASVVEDWYIDMDVAAEVQPGFLDPVTGMPDYRQASFEILEVWHGDVDAPTPWADFDRYGKYYYEANGVTVADFGAESIAYVACGLGGLVAVDVTGYAAATPNDFLEGAWLGYAPAVPARGPEEPTHGGAGPSTDSLFPHYGAGMLKEAGARDAFMFAGRLYYSDHFAGMVVLDHAEDPATYWRGSNAPYDNDDPTLGDGVLGDHWPDYEFVTSYDMSPYDPTDHESLPTWMFESPCVLATGEVGGHGSRLAPSSTMDPTALGAVDIAVCVGSGGMDLIDVDLDAPLLADRFTIPRYIPTTGERGAAADGTVGATISIGHSQGIMCTRRYLYLADGPHGVSAWQIADDTGLPMDPIALVGNTLQDEYPVDVAGTTVYPTPHASGVVFDKATLTALVMCQGRGVRRVSITTVEGGVGVPGAPVLLAPQATDIFEHNTEQGSVDGLPKQDHAYDAALEGQLCFVADGGNGLTVYDLTQDPTDLDGPYLVSNLGGSAGSKAPLGRATGIALWEHPVMMAKYAFIAAGPRGVGVVDVTHPEDPQLVKVFEPIKIEDDSVGKADGRAVDVKIYGTYAFFSYDSFGVLCYSIADLIEPLPQGIDPTKIWNHEGGVLHYDYRPETVAELRLRDLPEYAELGGGALYMSLARETGHLIVYAAYGVAGVLESDWTDPANPTVLFVHPTPGEASAVATHQGRLYVADGAAGLVWFE